MTNPVQKDADLDMALKLRVVAMFYAMRSQGEPDEHLKREAAKCVKETLPTVLHDFL